LALDAGGLRHPDVHQHDVGDRLAGDLHRLRAVRGLADEFDAVLFLEDHLKSATEQGVVVRDEHPDGLGFRLVRAGRRSPGACHPGCAGGHAGPIGHGRSFR
jgi:hypothetical protein